MNNKNNNNKKTHTHYRNVSKTSIETSYKEAKSDAHQIHDRHLNKKLWGQTTLKNLTRITSLKTIL